MFSRKLGLALGALILFLATVAFIVGHPPERDKRIYPLIRRYEPFIVENGLTGLKIRRSDDPDFSEEPDTVDFYSRLQSLERTWAAGHLRLTQTRVQILDRNGSLLATVPLHNRREKEFVIRYYGVRAP